MRNNVITKDEKELRLNTLVFFSVSKKKENFNPKFIHNYSPIMHVCINLIKI